MLLQGPDGACGGATTPPPTLSDLDAEMERLAPARGIMVGLVLSASLGGVCLGLRWMATA